MLKGKKKKKKGLCLKKPRTSSPLALGKLALAVSPSIFLGSDLEMTKGLGQCGSLGSGLLGLFFFFFDLKGKKFILLYEVLEAGSLKPVELCSLQRL